MIILATAIILALNGSGIIGKAHEAKTASDNASKKQAATLKIAEYELAVQNGETASINTWVKNSLTADGIDTSDMYITEDREVLVGLTKIAVSLLEAGVPIGATVEGYDISANPTTYTTDGRENTTHKYGEEEVKVAQTVTRVTSPTWKYMGVSDDGEALIVMDVIANAPLMKLGGIGGYLNGENALNNTCKALYGTDKGVARSINFEDVLKVLEYSGPQGQYSDESGTVIKTNKALTIGEIIGDSTTRLKSYNGTPDGTDIKEYKADYLSIFTGYTPGMQHPSDSYIKADETAQDLIFNTLGVDGSSDFYWIADRCTSVSFASGNNYALFSMRAVDTSWPHITALRLYYSIPGPASQAGVLRPVVELNESVTFTYADGTLTLN